MHSCNCVGRKKQARIRVCSCELEAPLYVAFGLLQIQRLELRARKGGPFALSNSLRKSAFKKLIWLEAQRETLHAIPAPDRKFQD